MATAELSLPLDERDLPERYEVINDIVVEKPFMSTFATFIASALIRELILAQQSKQTGHVMGECLFRIPLCNDRRRNRRPDAAFVSFARWPKERAIH